MALGVGLLMPPAPDGRPTMVYLLDLGASCGACGRDVIRRYYLDTPFHSLTLGRLHGLCTDAPGLMEGNCEQCDAPLGPNNVERWSVQCAPGDGVGLLIATQAVGQEARWHVAPHDFLDVQAQPVMEHPQEDISQVAIPSLQESFVYDALGRYFNPKSALRQWVLSHHLPSHACPKGVRSWSTGGEVLYAAPGLAFWLGQEEQQPPKADTIFVGGVSFCLVNDGVCADHYPDAPARWLYGLEPYLKEYVVMAYADPAVADASLRRHFGRFPIDIRYQEEGSALRVVAGDGSLAQSVLVFTPRDIAQEAARTGAAPGDIARAEIDRSLTMLDFTSG